MAGNGVIHSEFNASQTEPVHLLQVWITPAVEDVAPRYQQFGYDPSEKQGRLRLLVGLKENPPEPAAFIHQDARAYASVLGPGQSLERPIARGRHAWVQCARGNITVNELVLKEGDLAAVSEERAVTISGAGPAGGERLFIDLA